MMAVADQAVDGHVIIATLFCKTHQDVHGYSRCRTRSQTSRTGLRVVFLSRLFRILNNRRVLLGCPPEDIQAVQ